VTDPYEILGVPQDASAADIRAAYKKLAQQWHPDKHPNDIASATKRFQELDEAYTILSDAEKRARYDNLGDAEQSEENELATHAIRLLTESAMQLLDQPGDHRDILRKMCDVMIEKHKASIQDALIRIRKREQLATRWKTKLGGRNIFANALRREILRLREHIETSKVAIDIAKECLRILAEYEYDPGGTRQLAAYGSIFRSDIS